MIRFLSLAASVVTSAAARHFSAVTRWIEQRQFDSRSMYLDRGTRKAPDNSIRWRVFWGSIRAYIGGNRSVMKYISFILFSAPFLAHAQAASDPHKYPFWQTAQVSIPAWYDAGRFDSIDWYFRNVSDEYAIVFAIKALNAIQTGTFNIGQLPCNLRSEHLQAYVNNHETLQRGLTFWVYTGGRHAADMGRYVKPLFVLAARWASELLRNRNDLDTTETFLCRVFAGQILQPARYLRQHKDGYAALEQQSWSCFAKLRSFTDPRSGLIFELGTGAWLPTGPLGILGVHPSIDLQFGSRKKRTEVVIYLGGRFLQTPNAYQVYRKDTLRSLTYYSVFNAGFSYTYYVYERTRWELGLKLCIGGENLSIDGGDSSQNKYLDPKVLGTFDWPIGIRFNWFCRRRWHMGAETAYHILNYQNTKGSDLRGDAFTAKFFIGVN
jgi:hypothetical protein